jgi:putative GTP pyrophosphokinase
MRGDEAPFDDRLRAAVQEYATRQPGLRDASALWTQLVTSLLDDAGINYLSVTGRAKSVTSFATKAVRVQDGVPLYDDPLTQITDQIGVRVIAYLHGDVDAVAELFEGEMQVLDDRDMGRETAEQGVFGYSSRHLLVELDESWTDHPVFAALRGTVASVQVRTVLQHAWAEFEHEVRYKGTVPAEDAPDLNRRFTLAAGLLELADHEFTSIRERLQASMGERPVDPANDDPRVTPHELAAFLTGQFPDAGWSRTDHYAWIGGLVLELGIASLEELEEVLREVDHQRIHERMAYKYPPGAVRRLDDALLATFGERYVNLVRNADRVDLLRARLAKLRGPTGTMTE